MSGRDEDEAWRAIVENYGERPSVDEEPSDPEPTAPEPSDLGQPATGPLPVGPEGGEGHEGGEPHEPEGFVPPVPPPGPPLQLPQHLPWIGVFGSPALLLVSTLLGIDLPRWAGYLLVLAFAGGFVWLVATMKRGPGDPWDDGARV